MAASPKPTARSQVAPGAGAEATPGAIGAGAGATTGDGVEATGAGTGAGATAGSQVPELSRSLRPRHVTMISLGGIIGAGLFVGSSVAISATGPMVIVTYALTGLMVLIVMRCLGKMAVSRSSS